MNIGWIKMNTSNVTLERLLMLIFFLEII